MLWVSKGGMSASVSCGSKIILNDEKYTSCSEPSLSKFLPEREGCKNLRSVSSTTYMKIRSYKCNQ